MKRYLAIFLAALMLAASLASCAAVSRDARIRVTSSDGEAAAAWLTARLGEKLTGRVVLGTDADGYGVDLASLEDDGYFIRSYGGEDVLFAKTADGLDRAMRRYAKLVEAGEPIADETYHEGARVERLTIAGNDISTYAIKVEGGSEYWHNRVVNETAAAFSELLGIACGFAPEVGGEAQNTILFKWIENDDFSEGTFRYHVENGDLVIEFVELLGANYAMQMIMEDELGWIDMTAGFDYLPEADAIDIPADRDVTVHPMFDAYIPGSLAGVHSYTTKNVGFFANKDGWAGHGLMDRRFYDIFPPNQSEQPCMTDEIVREATVEVIIEDFILPVLNAGGHIGEELREINLGQRDGTGPGTFCKCKNCRAVFTKEGSWSGPYVRWVNAIDDAIDEAGYEGLVYNMFAYTDSKYPPKYAVPNDDVYIMMCTDVACDKHLLDGSQCQWKTFLAGHPWYDNTQMSEWIGGWGKLCDNLYIYHYALNCSFTPHCMLDTLYEDNLTFKRLGVRRMMWEVANYDYHWQWSPNGGKGFPKLGFYMIMQAMCVWQNLHPDATKEDYRDHYQITLERLYGDGWRDVARFIDLWDEAELAVQNCSHCWGDAEGFLDTYYEKDTFLSSWEEMISCLKRAELQASDAAMEERILTFLAQAYFSGCALGYGDAKAAGDEAQIALYTERYDAFVSILKDLGYGLEYQYLGESRLTISESIDELWPKGESLY